MITTFGCAHSGLSSGSGSVSKTSSTAAAERPVVERPQQGGLVDDRAPADVHEERARPHGAEEDVVDKVLGRGVGRRAEDDDIGLGEDVRQAVRGDHLVDRLVAGRGGAGPR